MGGTSAGPIYGESRLTELLDQHLRASKAGRGCGSGASGPGQSCWSQFEGNPSPREGGELLLWDVHQDTVPVDGMTVEPFGGEVRDGRVYGAGRAT